MPFLVIGGAIAIFYILRKSGSAKTLRIYFRDIIFRPKSGFNLPDIYARFNVINGSPTTLTLDSLTGDIFINGVVLSSVSQLQKQDFSPNSETVISIKVATPGAQAVLSLLQLLREKTKGITVSFEGNVRSEGVIIPISKSIKLI